MDDKNKNIKKDAYTYKAITMLKFYIGTAILSLIFYVIRYVCI